MRSLLLSLLLACSGSAPKPHATSSAPAPAAPATPPVAAKPDPDAGARCVGPLLRGAKNPQKYACRNASGGWSQEIGCWKCKLENGACRHPEVPMQPAEANVKPIGPIPAGPCRAECCDPNLGTLPPDVEDGMLDPGFLGG